MKRIIFLFVILLLDTFSGLSIAQIQNTEEKDSLLLEISPMPAVIEGNVKSNRSKRSVRNANITTLNITPGTSYTHSIQTNELIRPATSNYGVGEITMTAEITPNGSASASIPIEIPPVVSGMQPQIALTYNSLSGNGVAGYGWHLSGLSTLPGAQLIGHKTKLYFRQQKSMTTLP